VDWAVLTGHHADVARAMLDRLDQAAAMESVERADRT
jgi:hypothetical protein